MVVNSQPMGCELEYWMDGNDYKKRKRTNVSKRSKPKKNHV
jgi:hypothetical protein